jgi:ABC-type uncharacterized transport system permease subunit
VLLIAGDQVPEIPLVELVGSGGIVVPKQNGPTCVNVGIIFGVIVIIIVWVVAQRTVVGVKV